MKKTKKKLISLLSLLCIICVLLSACTGNIQASSQSTLKQNLAVQKALLGSELASVSQPSSEVSEVEYKTTVQLFNRAPDNPMGFTCSVYVITTDEPTKGTIVVDPGSFTPEMQEYVSKHGGVDAIWISHSHWDHIYGVDAIKAAYPDAKVYINTLDEPGLTDTVLNWSDYRGFSLQVQSQINNVDEGDHIIAGYKAVVIHFSGHTAGGSLLYLPEENLMFSGDCFNLNFVDGEYRQTDHSDNMARTNSIVKFKALPFPDDLMIYNGHGTQSFTYEQVMRDNPDFQD